MIRACIPAFNLIGTHSDIIEIQLHMWMQVILDVGV